MKDIDGYVTKDELYRLISRIKYRPNMVVDHTTCHIITEAIYNMPKVDVQPIVYAHKTINVGSRSYCSNCGKLAIMEDFCSKCGAKVTEGDING